MFGVSLVAAAGVRALSGRAAHATVIVVDCGDEQDRTRMEKSQEMH